MRASRSRRDPKSPIRVLVESHLGSRSAPDAEDDKEGKVRLSGRVGERLACHRCVWRWLLTVGSFGCALVTLRSVVSPARHRCCRRHQEV